MKINLNYLLHYKDEVLFFSPKIHVRYQLMASRETKENNVLITKVFDAPNNTSFTVKDFVEIFFENYHNDLKFHLPISTSLDGDNFPNELDRITIDTNQNIIDVNMYY